MKQIRVTIERTETGKSLPLPSYQTSQAAGMDLYACTNEKITLKPGEIRLIPTGIKIALQDGYEAQIRPRSGLALKHGITMVNAPGTIDADYRGEIKVIMINHGGEDFQFDHGERIAQMVIAPIVQCQWLEIDELPTSERGDGGFGHTGR